MPPARKRPASSASIASPSLRQAGTPLSASQRQRTSDHNNNNNSRTTSGRRKKQPAPSATSRRSPAVLQPQNKERAMRGRENESDGENESQDECRSSDARWRKNLKQAFRLVRDVSSPSQWGLPVTGKNMRRDILMQAMTVIEQLEDDVSLFVNIREIRSVFEQMELKNRFDYGSKSLSASIAPAPKKKKTEAKHTSKCCPFDYPPASATATSETHNQSQDELRVATRFLHEENNSCVVYAGRQDEDETVTDDDEDEDDGGLLCPDLHMHPFMTSTPNLSVPVMDGELILRRSKTKFAPEKKPDNVRRRLDMDSLVEEGGGDGPPVPLEQSVDEYLETSFTQLLHMSTGGTLYCEPNIVATVALSESDLMSQSPCVFGDSVAYDVEVQEGVDYLIEL